MSSMKWSASLKCSSGDTSQVCCIYEPRAYIWIMHSGLDWQENLGLLSRSPQISLRFPKQGCALWAVTCPKEVCGAMVVTEPAVGKKFCWQAVFYLHTKLCLAPSGMTGLENFLNHGFWQLQWDFITFFFSFFFNVITSALTWHVTCASQPSVGKLGWCMFLQHWNGWAERAVNERVFWLLGQHLFPQKLKELQ